MINSRGDPYCLGETLGFVVGEKISFAEHEDRLKQMSHYTASISNNDEAK